MIFLCKCSTALNCNLSFLCQFLSNTSASSFFSLSLVNGFNNSFTKFVYGKFVTDSCQSMALYERLEDLYDISVPSYVWEMPFKQCQDFLRENKHKKFDYEAQVHRVVKILVSQSCQTLNFSYHALKQGYRANIMLGFMNRNLSVKRTDVILPLYNGVHS